MDDNFTKLSWWMEHFGLPVLVLLIGGVSALVWQWWRTKRKTLELGSLENEGRGFSGPVSPPHNTTAPSPPTLKLSNDQKELLRVFYGNNLVEFELLGDNIRWREEPGWEDHQNMPSINVSEPEVFRDAVAELAQQQLLSVENSNLGPRFGKTKTGRRLVENMITQPEDKASLDLTRKRKVEFISFIARWQTEIVNISEHNGAQRVWEIYNSSVGDFSGLVDGLRTGFTGTDILIFKNESNTIIGLRSGDVLNARDPRQVLWAPLEKLSHLTMTSL